jgi:hypothetical protein
MKTISSRLKTAEKKGDTTRSADLNKQLSDTKRLREYIKTRDWKGADAAFFNAWRVPLPVA